MIAATAASAEGTVVAIVVVEDGAVVGAGVAEATGIIADKVDGICRRRSTHLPRASGIRGATITAGKAIGIADCLVPASVATTISSYPVNPWPSIAGVRSRAR
jgi:hypothetical protein